MGSPSDWVTTGVEDDAARPLVLVVDDVDDIRTVVRFELEHEGFDVQDVGTGAEAIEAAHRCKPDLVLLDLTMPGVDGWDVLRALRAPAESIGGMSIAVYTGEADELVEQRALAAGAGAYLAKPICAADLARALRGLLESRTAAVGVA